MAHIPSAKQRASTAAPEQTSSKELPFEGFLEYIAQPLATSDAGSFERIKRLFLETSHVYSDPFGMLIRHCTGRNDMGKDARSQWSAILSHKHNLEQKLGRTVSIEVAARDFLDVTAPTQASSPPGKQRLASDSIETPVARPPTSGYHQEILKKELARAKRYKHALSAILLDIDEFHKINESFSFKTGDELLSLIVKIIQKTIRTVDILTRHSGDHFFIVCPNTNQREAQELAERLRANIHDRTKRIHTMASGVTATLAVGQVVAGSSSADFFMRMESVLAVGKAKRRNAVHTL
jgi:diguanylate cyclase (GGDEF)-like protein